MFFSGIFERIFRPMRLVPAVADFFVIQNKTNKYIAEGKYIGEANLSAENSENSSILPGWESLLGAAYSADPMT